MKTSKHQTVPHSAVQRAIRPAITLTTLGIHLLGFVTTAIAAPGDLDSSFGTGGITDPVITGNARDVAVQVDGKVVVIGSHVVIVRYTGDGQLDLSFSGDG